MLSSARYLFLAAIALGLGGCVTGGLTAASLGPAPAGVAALKGGLISQAREVSLSAEAERAALGAEYQALQFGRVGQPVPWEADGFSGQVVPTQLYRVGSQDCRGYTHSVTRGTASVQAVGTACREGNLWTPVA